MAEIVDIKPGRLPLTDIPGHLRKMADKYEAGDYPGVDYIMIIVPAEDQEADWPQVIGIGKDPGSQARCGLVALVQSWLTINMVARHG
jgi:hypothetical protein